MNDAMAVDREARNELQKALVSYMSGEIRTLAFDDQYSSVHSAIDESVNQISSFIFRIHDDFIDHPISVSPEEWAILRRIVAFLNTNLDIAMSLEQSTWPFQSRTEWDASEHVLNDLNLPEYESSVHGCEIARPWSDNVPLGVSLIVILLFAVALTILLF